ncbi:MAG: nicotinate-nucleotide adenylyltransferase [Cyclobacteriaceae bacterium]|nr:nicotinate-nucleotide adenylyltransferase [Cyclobacteriaceae bacterium]MCK5702716.1 nicotinate-nucleotide adenylyltransferase [Cyclobacteriaceae bacterium]
MKAGLYFGSFNPIHNGHLIIAQAVQELAKLDKVWFIVSPQNPLKRNKSLLHEFDRYDMVKLAIEDNDRFKVSDIEFNMPRPSFTIDTLAYLKERHPGIQFKLIIGGDNLSIFPKWKNSQKIIKDFGLIVYPRPGSKQNDLINHPNVVFIEAPLLDISATFIRKCIKENRSIRYLVPEKAADFICDRKLYI